MRPEDYIKPGWGATPYDWQITGAYCDVFGVPPKDMTMQEQLTAILDVFADYRTEFGQLDQVRCDKCHSFFIEFGECLYCDDEVNCGG